jgi:hypothetical protein
LDLILGGLEDIRWRDQLTEWNRQSQVARETFEERICDTGLTGYKATSKRRGQGRCQEQESGKVTHDGRLVQDSGTRRSKNECGPGILGDDSRCCGRKATIWNVADTCNLYSELNSPLEEDYQSFAWMPKTLAGVATI